MMLLLLVAMIAALAALAGWMWMRRFAREFLRVRGRKTPITPADRGIPFSPFEIAVPEGTVRGWFLRAAEEPRATVVLAHGWQSNAGDMVAWAAPIVALGYHVVLFDTIGHGESDASEHTSIRQYRDDLRAVLTWTMAQPLAAPGIALMGHSMGGAAAVLVASGEPKARALITAGAPTDALSITREWFAAKGLPAGLMISLLRPHWAAIIRASYDDVDPMLKLSSVRCPMLILHGARDRHVGVHHGQVIAAAKPDATLVIFPDGDHLDLPARPEYAREIGDFLARSFAHGIEA